MRAYAAVIERDAVKAAEPALRPAFIKAALTVLFLGLMTSRGAFGTVFANNRFRPHLAAIPLSESNVLLANLYSGRCDLLSVGGRRTNLFRVGSFASFLCPDGKRVFCIASNSVAAFDLVTSVRTVLYQHTSRIGFLALARNELLLGEPPPSKRTLLLSLASGKIVWERAIEDRFVSASSNRFYFATDPELFSPLVGDWPRNAALCVSAYDWSTGTNLWSRYLPQRESSAMRDVFEAGRHLWVIQPGSVLLLSPETARIEKEISIARGVTAWRTTTNSVTSLLLAGPPALLAGPTVPLAGSVLWNRLYSIDAEGIRFLSSLPNEMAPGNLVPLDPNRILVGTDNDTHCYNVAESKVEWRKSGAVLGAFGQTIFCSEKHAYSPARKFGLWGDLADRRDRYVIWAHDIEANTSTKVAEYTAEELSQ